MPLCHDLITSVLPVKPSPTKTKRRKMPLKITHNSKIYFPSFMDSLLEVKPKQIKGKGHKLSEKMGARTRTRQIVNLCYLVWPKVTTIIAQALEFAIKFLDPHSSNVLHERIKRHGHNLYAVRLCPWTHNLAFHFRNLLKMVCRTRWAFVLHSSQLLTSNLKGGEKAKKIIAPKILK